MAIQASLERAEIKTGEQTAINLKIRTNDIQHTKFYIKENLHKGEPYTIIDFIALDTIDLGSNIKEITARIRLTSFDSTLVKVSPIVVETPTHIAETESLALNVVQPEVNAQQPGSFKDIKMPWTISLRFWDWLELILFSWLFWLILSIIVFSYVLYYLLNRAKKPLQEEEEEISRLSLWEKTDRRLQALEETRLWEQAAFKLFYTELVAIVKDYLDESRGWETVEMTTSELREKLRTEQISQKDRKVLEEVFQEADLSKFAKYTPSADTMKKSLFLMRDLLKTWEQGRGVPNDKESYVH